MLPWIQLDTAAVPGGGVLRLMRRGEEFSIRLDRGTELMNSRVSGSEEALATLSLEHLAGRDAPRILIGGLGMGFTLRAAQAAVGPHARLVVAEIVPEIVAWARGQMSAIFGESLADPRLDLRISDVGESIQGAHAVFDAILLDVDNGPDGLTLPGNGALYDAGGLKAAHRAIAPGGVLAVWSARPDPAFTQRLRACGFDARTEQVRARKGGRGARHTIWLATRPQRPGTGGAAR